jgi:hypothetical protein
MKIEKFWSRVDVGKPNECWPWKGANNNKGYGLVAMNGRRTMAHRVAYELTLGPIPEGFEVDHVRDRGCQSRACCNPFHLEAVTPEENKLRSDWDGVTNARKTQCKRGHPYTPENTGLGSKGWRYCKACQRMYNASCRKRQKQLHLEADYGI